MVECAGNFKTSKKENKSPSRSLAAGSATTELRYASPTALAASATGSECNPSMFRLCPAGSVKRCCGLPGVGGPPARRNHDPPNLRAQCKQTRNFCQGKIGDKAQNLGASCLMCLSLVVTFQTGTTGKARGASGNLHNALLQTIPHNRCALSTSAVQIKQTVAEFSEFSSAPANCTRT